MRITSGLLLLLLFLLPTVLPAQNLPSLLLQKNINATFAIIGYDPLTKEWGIAVATNNIYVGNSTTYIEPGAGAIAVIAETEPAYGLNGLAQMKAGKTPQEAFAFTQQTDTDSSFRQVGMLDKNGQPYAITGHALSYWQGMAGHQAAQNCVVLGNQLAPGVLTSMHQCFDSSRGPLAERLLQALMAGQQAGGQLSGKQSAALLVKGLQQEWFNHIDLRVDHSLTPFQDLRRLLDYHYGRITINQAVTQIRQGNREKGTALLNKAQAQVKGWTGIYGKLVQACLLLNNTARAVSLIHEALQAEPQWKENLPAFYCLKNEKALAGLIREDRFMEKDWYAAIRGYLNIEQTAAAITLANKVLQQYPRSSYTYYLLGQAFLQSAAKDKAKAALQKALELDAANTEAVQALQELNTH